MATGKGGPSFDGSSIASVSDTLLWGPLAHPRARWSRYARKNIFTQALNRLLDTFLSTFADTDHRNNRRHTDDNAQVVNPVLSLLARNEASAA
ncbi:MAG: hypothetical protein Ct9H300mP14_12400 [Gammaproteobacteria bacterium]|nr:MAG: hypothetical protein Ct9H300mP14_12400 [Gammaproteobacteria bacterium]